ncbi:LicD family protein [Sedimentibacter sp.]|uniref:LicD family protein n=1 Tax=Sedimentibacter sp. TaxID=1960295 RepID=UPI00289C6E1F|nr:LicD family protein [Sedimentibacter sp.]
MYNENLRNVQLIELDILKEVDRICKKNNIEYFLDSGTALGAVRHQGFIPWDDDIDIGMTRANYNKFLTVAQKELKDDFFLQTKDTDPKAPYYFAKVRKNNTVFMEWNKRNLDMHQGIYIDIFPYDNLPDNVDERIKFQKKCCKLYRFYTIRSTMDRDVKPQKTAKWLLVALIRRMIHFIVKPIPINLVKEIVDRSFMKYNNVYTEYFTCLAYGKSYIFNKNDFFPLKEAKFEDDFFRIAGNYDAYLKELYGDYMKLPPEDQRKGHMPFKLNYK